MTTKQEALQLITDKLKQADALVRECTVIAEEHDVAFSHDVVGVYGTGARFINPSYRAAYDEDDLENGWYSSADKC